MQVNERILVFEAILTTQIRQHCHVYDVPSLLIPTLRNPVVSRLRVGDSDERPSTPLRSAQGARWGFFDCISLRFIPLRSPR